MPKRTTQGEPGAVEAERLKIQYVLDRKHVDALRRAAFEKAQRDGTYRPDASALLREILDAWMAKRK